MIRWLSKFKSPVYAMLLLGMGLFFLFMLGQIDTLRCERVSAGQSAVRCSLVTSWMNQVKLREQEIGSVQHASVQQNCNSEGCSYRVSLITDRGSASMSNIYTSNRAGHQATADRINAYLDAKNQPDLEIASGGGWQLVIPALMLLGGLVLAFSSVRGLLNPRE